MKVKKEYDGTRPGATPGRVFTSSISQETIQGSGAELSYLKLGLKGAITTASVALEAFAGVLSEYTFKVKGEERIVLDGGDLVALMAFYYGEVPRFGENTDNTGTNYLGGVKIPIYEKFSADKPFTHEATRTAVTNVGTETLGVSSYWDTNEAERKPIHAVKITHTTAGSAGYETLGFRIVPKGNMIGLIIGQPNGFDDGNIDISVQRVNLLVDGEVMHELNSLTDAVALAEVDYVTPGPIADLLRPYTVFDFRKSGVDVKGKEVTIQLDVQDASDAIDIIPVIELV